jgi:hypothetical protein
MKIFTTILLTPCSGMVSGALEDAGKTAAGGDHGTGAP